MTVAFPSRPTFIDYSDIEALRSQKAIECLVEGPKVGRVNLKEYEGRELVFELIRSITRGIDVVDLKALLPKALESFFKEYPPENKEALFKVIKKFAEKYPSAFERSYFFLNLLWALNQSEDPKKLEVIAEIVKIWVDPFEAWSSSVALIVKDPQLTPHILNLLHGSLVYSWIKGGLSVTGYPLIDQNLCPILHHRNAAARVNGSPAFVMAQFMESTEYLLNHCGPDVLSPQIDLNKQPLSMFTEFVQIYLKKHAYLDKDPSLTALNHVFQEIIKRLKNREWDFLYLDSAFAEYSQAIKRHLLDPNQEMLHLFMFRLRRGELYLALPLFSKQNLDLLPKNVQFAIGLLSLKMNRENDRFSLLFFHRLVETGFVAKGKEENLTLTPEMLDQMDPHDLSRLLSYFPLNAEKAALFLDRLEDCLLSKLNEEEFIAISYILKALLPFCDQQERLLVIAKKIFRKEVRKQETGSLRATCDLALALKAKMANFEKEQYYQLLFEKACVAVFNAVFNQKDPKAAVEILVSLLDQKLAAQLLQLSPLEILPFLFQKLLPDHRFAKYFMVNKENTPEQAAEIENLLHPISHAIPEESFVHKMEASKKEGKTLPDIEEDLENYDKPFQMETLNLLLEYTLFVIQQGDLKVAKILILRLIRERVLFDDKAFQVLCKVVIDLKKTPESIKLLALVASRFTLETFSYLLTQERDLDVLIIVWEAIFFSKNEMKEEFFQCLVTYFPIDKLDNLCTWKLSPEMALFLLDKIYSLHEKFSLNPALQTLLEKGKHADEAARQLFQSKLFNHLLRYVKKGDLKAIKAMQEKWRSIKGDKSHIKKSYFLALLEMGAIEKAIGIMPVEAIDRECFEAISQAVHHLGNLPLDAKTLSFAEKLLQRFPALLPNILGLLDKASLQFSFERYELLVNFLHALFEKGLRPPEMTALLLNLYGRYSDFVLDNLQKPYEAQTPFTPYGKSFLKLRNMLPGEERPFNGEEIVQVIKSKHMNISNLSVLERERYCRQTYHLYRWAFPILVAEDPRSGRGSLKGLFFDHNFFFSEKLQELEALLAEYDDLKMPFIVLNQETDTLVVSSDRKFIEERIIIERKFLERVARDPSAISLAQLSYKRIVLLCGRILREDSSYEKAFLGDTNFAVLIVQVLFAIAGNNLSKKVLAKILDELFETILSQQTLYLSIDKERALNSKINKLKDRRAARTNTHMSFFMKHSESFLEYTLFILLFLREIKTFFKLFTRSEDVDEALRKKLNEGARIVRRWYINDETANPRIATHFQLAIQGTCYKCLKDFFSDEDLKGELSKCLSKALAFFILDITDSPERWESFLKRDFSTINATIKQIAHWIHANPMLTVTPKSSKAEQVPSEETEKLINKIKTKL